MKTIKAFSPGTGKIYPLEKFPDEIIADKVMGDGYAIELTGNEIVAPFDGVIKVAYPTGHAVCLGADDGVQLMIHIGVDTFAIQDLNRLHVSVGDKVRKGDLLISTDVRILKKKTGNSFAAVVYLHQEKVEELKTGFQAEALDEIGTIKVAEDD